MDLSFLPELVTLGTRFKDENNAVITNNYAYLASKGVNLVRLRLWVNHSNQAYNLTKIKAQAILVKNAGMDFLLDFHYSDTWGDPGNQQTPAVWSGMDVNALSTAVASYTTIVLQELKIQQTVPVIVQIGNETNNGMLWPVGQIYTRSGTNWDNYATITKAAITAVKSSSPTSQIMIHYAGVSNAVPFYKALIDRGVQFDIAGLSYYPWWHGNNVANMQSGLMTVSRDLTQDIMVVETAYPFTLAFNDNVHNNVGMESQLAPFYPASPAGQHDFLLALHNALKRVPNNRGIGYCYWAPDWVAHTPSSSSFTQGSSWENVTLFDFNNEVNPAIEVYGLD